MKVILTPIKDLIIIDPKSHHDERGFFLKLFSQNVINNYLIKKLILFKIIYLVPVKMFCVGYIIRSNNPKIN